jgi:transcriptional regulator with XRE-family HTH domain
MKNKKHKFILNNLRRCRKIRGLTQRRVAEILELKSTSMISRWEAGQCFPDTLNVFRLAIIYRSSPDALFLDFIRELRDALIKKEEKILNNRSNETQCN